MSLVEGLYFNYLSDIMSAPVAYCKMCIKTSVLSRSYVTSDGQRLWTTTLVLSIGLKTYVTSINYA